MTTHRLYNLSGLLISLALVSAGVLAIPMVVGALNVPSISSGSGGAVIANSNAGAADPARLEFRRGEWFGGRDEVNAADQARMDFRRGEWFGGRDDPNAADQARMDFRRGEWFGGRENAQVAPTNLPVEPDFLNYLWYTK